jgi:hypothetical protein
MISAKVRLGRCATMMRAIMLPIELPWMMMPPEVIRLTISQHASA